MGLDQYANRRNSKGEDTEINYWRKHNALQGWMEQLWAIKTGKSGNDLNCNEVELTMPDLEQLKNSINNQTLPETQGFFFGHDSRFDEHKKEITLSFVDTAETKIADGQKIFYSCSW